MFAAVQQAVIGVLVSEAADPQDAESLCRNRMCNHAQMRACHGVHHRRMRGISRQIRAEVQSTAAMSMLTKEKRNFRFQHFTAGNFQYRVGEILVRGIEIVSVQIKEN